MLSCDRLSDFVYYSILEATKKKNFFLPPLPCIPKLMTKKGKPVWSKYEKKQNKCK